MKILGEIIVYALFMAVVGLFSAWPQIRQLDADKAIISVSFSLAGQRIGECRQLTQEELNELAPNMRRPAKCPRERHAVRVEIAADEAILYSDTLLPSGFWSDGASIAYQRVVVPAGEYNLRMSLDDIGSETEFRYSQVERVNIVPGRHLIIRFDRLSKRFEFE